MKRRILRGTATLAVLVLPVVCIFFACERHESGESSAVGSVKAITEAEETYRSSYGGYAPALANLGGSPPCTASATTACLLDTVLTQGNKAGYRFALVGDNPVNGRYTGYVAGAAPWVYGRAGRRRFCTTEKGVMRYDSNSSGNTAPPNREQCERFAVLE